MSVLAPALDRGREDPRFVSAWLRLMTARAWATRTAWTPVPGLTEAVSLGQSQLDAHPDDPELAKALKAICEVVPQACIPPGSPPAMAAPGAP